jgi:hypothetical protein
MVRQIKSGNAPLIVMTVIAGTALLLRASLMLEHLR